MDFNYKLYYSFFISITFHLVLVLIFSLIAMPKILLPEKPLEIDIVDIVPLITRAKKMKRVVFKKVNKTRQAKKKRVLKKNVVTSRKQKLSFEYTQSENERLFFNKVNEGLVVKRIKEGHELSRLASPLLENLDKLSFFKERNRPKLNKINNFIDFTDDLRKKNTESSSVSSVSFPSASNSSSFEKIVWEKGINRKRLYAPLPPESHSPKTGKVVVLFWVDRDGFVSKATIRKKLAIEQDQLALNYVKQFKFEPYYTLEQGERHKGSISILFERME